MECKITTEARNMEHLLIKWGIGKDFPSHHNTCVLDSSEEGIAIYTHTSLGGEGFYKFIKVNPCTATKMIDETLGWLNTIDDMNIDKYKEKYEDFGGSCYTYREFGGDY